MVIAELEKLPYLVGPSNLTWEEMANDGKAAVIQEGLRFVYGAGHRLQRVAPNDVLQYKDWAIPPGTSTGMTTFHVHNNPEIFPEPKKFSPERWIENPRLDKYLLSFSKG